MGKKQYFEFLEEAFQSLTSEVQKALASLEPSNPIQSDKFSIGLEGDDFDDVAIDPDDPKKPKSGVSIPKLFTRCKAVFQKMYYEAQGDPEFQERLALYKLQLQALSNHYEEKMKEQKEDEVHEMVFAFEEQDWML